MNQEIIDWYSDRHYQPHKMFAVGKTRDHSQAKIETSMVHCYDKIISGKRISDIDVARYVFNIAKNVDASKYEERLRVLLDAENEIKVLKKSIKEKVQDLKAFEDFKVLIYASGVLIIFISLLIGNSI